MQKQFAILIDILLTIVFIAIGRASHSEGLRPVEILQTAWPFLLALAIGWVVMLVRKREHMGVGAGIFLWITTWIGGIILRVASGDTAETAFIIVAGVTLAVFLIGWRLLAKLLPAK
ncbi:DUF3054 domain-containing protein [Aestuariimicrobium sp. p3-SID1156]|uniref:DUF3054 domain-containing protein n=1 Tax=Aestuariimicrobium sp. p3-SID1156 TaxID=2916038 RepID=UPI00223AFAC0|nr:DUF3054 domain-containing protein [Aestuariimicrobium sp. p3-SID1156]MCT1460220.1 DUF3054 domain-containing protein [Aestuariimicrobium sp. p3-SID1156]